MGTAREDTWSADSFVGGHVALDFVNTAAGRTRRRDVELLDTVDAAIAWAHAVGAVDGRERRLLTGGAREHPARASDALAALWGQRESLHAFLLAGLLGAEPASSERERVEADLRDAYGAARLGPRTATHGAWRVDLTSAGHALVGRRLALAAGSLLVSPQAGQVAVCARCSWMFLDPSPTRRRRWCSMATCGNRAKAERHHRAAE